MARQIPRGRGRPPTGSANQSEINNVDAAGREEGRAKDEPLSDFESEVQGHEGGAQPVSEVTAGPQGGTPDEDKNGLDEVARALREAAEGPADRKEIPR